MNNLKLGYTINKRPNNINTYEIRNSSEKSKGSYYEVDKDDMILFL